jgi:tetratricopeptide (TPR) repeat protein
MKRWSCALQLRQPVLRGAADWLIRRRLNLEAMLRFDRGEIPVAEQLWGDVVEHASRSGDPALLSAAYNNLGVIYTLQDRVEDALASYNRALVASRQLGDRRAMAQSHQNLAILFREMALHGDADTHFMEALREARSAGSDDVRGRVDEERALLLLDQDDVPMAEATALRALRILSHAGDASGEGEALRVLGIIALRQRAFDLARERFRGALEIAGSRHVTRCLKPRRWRQWLCSTRRRAMRPVQPSGCNWRLFGSHPCAPRHPRVPRSGTDAGST